MGEAQCNIANHLPDAEITQNRGHDAQLLDTNRIDLQLSELAIALGESFACLLIESAPISQQPVYGYTSLLQLDTCNRALQEFGKRCWRGRKYRRLRQIETRLECGIGGRPIARG